MHKAHSNKGDQKDKSKNKKNKDVLRNYTSIT